MISFALGLCVAKTYLLAGEKELNMDKAGLMILVIMMIATLLVMSYVIYSQKSFVKKKHALQLIPRQKAWLIENGLYQSFNKELANLDLAISCSFSKSADINSNINANIDAFMLGNDSYPGQTPDLERRKQMICSKNSKSRIGLILLAGGQASRMGIQGSKGSIHLDIDEKSVSLFEIQCLKIKAAQNLYGCFFPLAVMASEGNIHEIEETFKEHDYWGLEPSTVEFFTQESTPLIWKEDGKSVAISPNGNLLSGPNGNGGVFHYAYSQGILSKWKDSSVEYMITFFVDNPLFNPLDPYFIEAFLSERKEKISLCGLAIKRESPEEKVGVFGHDRGQLKVLEYSEVPKAILNEFSWANSGIFAWNLDTLLELIPKYPLDKFALHWAEKKYLIMGGELETFLKREYFIFDWMEIFNQNGKKSTLFARRREECFHPVKYRDNSLCYSPLSAQNALKKLHMKLQGDKKEFEWLFYHLDP